MSTVPLDHRPDEFTAADQGHSASSSSSSSPSSSAAERALAAAASESQFKGNVPGGAVDNRRQLLVKLCWMLLWTFYLVYPVKDLASGRHGPTVTLLGCAGLVGFLACYLILVIFRSMRGVRWRGSYPLVAVMAAIALGSSLGLGANWLVLFNYLSVAVGAVLVPRFALAGVATTTAVMAAVAVSQSQDLSTIGVLALPSFLSGAAMTGLQRLVGVMRELRDARETVAHLAVAEERLRLARDMHDLLGHSLSLIALKSELAGRFMTAGQQDAARAQVADIEQVARESLTDVRAAITGYRKPTLPVELSAARRALATAGVTLEAPAALAEDRPGLGAAEAETLAWALREAVTNIVRHADGATLCTVGMDETWDGEGGRYAVLEITDNGAGPGKSGPGNGLSGLDERLALVGGRLETSPGQHGKGFRIRALVPLGVRVG
ncbi:sensor histidine kinase [Kitasatospora kifunensis]|uniref:Two-component system sensor histidine kinase DesK n=1 Tax=Kitasatospora kifunensis TaxID=58351 RepID=A0A7W7R1M1_KITKI|nr:sensor histidine kinase [Kitasatospora kifunensis]MBB4923732.1 two-component system sensor histidine kinase DesK [Kitasatospora kifunensis]